MKHLAVFTDDMIALIFQGRKTIDCRLSIKKIPPFGVIQAHDTVFIKRSGGKVVGQFVAERVIFFDNLTSAMINDVKNLYGDAIQAPDLFWQRREEAKYATLIFITEVQPSLMPISVQKHDRRPWILVDSLPVKDRPF